MSTTATTLTWKVQLTTGIEPVIIEIDLNQPCTYNIGVAPNIQQLQNPQALLIQLEPPYIQDKQEHRKAHLVSTDGVTRDYAHILTVNTKKPFTLTRNHITSTVIIKASFLLKQHSRMVSLQKIPSVQSLWGMTTGWQKYYLEHYAYSQHSVEKEEVKEEVTEEVKDEVTEEEEEVTEEEDEVKEEVTEEVIEEEEKQERKAVQFFPDKSNCANMRYLWAGDTYSQYMLLHSQLEYEINYTNDSSGSVFICINARKCELNMNLLSHIKCWVFFKPRLRKKEPNNVCTLINVSVLNGIDREMLRLYLLDGFERVVSFDWTLSNLICHRCLWNQILSLTEAIKKYQNEHALQPTEVSTETVQKLLNNPYQEETEVKEETVVIVEVKEETVVVVEVEEETEVKEETQVEKETIVKEQDHRIAQQVSNTAIIQNLGRLSIKQPYNGGVPEKFVFEVLPHETVTENDRHFQCCICRTEYKNGDITTTLPCMCKYHLDCISIWLNSHNNCPWCRSEIIPAMVFTL